MSYIQVLLALGAVESALSDLIGAFRDYEHALSCSSCNINLAKRRKMMIRAVNRLLWAVIRLPKAYLLSNRRSANKYVTFSEFLRIFPGLSEGQLEVFEAVFHYAPGGKLPVRQVTQ